MMTFLFFQAAFTSSQEPIYKYLLEPASTKKRFRYHMDFYIILRVSYSFSFTHLFFVKKLYYAVKQIGIQIHLI